MGIYVSTYIFDGKINDSVKVSFVQKGVEIEPCIQVGLEKTEEIIFTRGSYELYMQKERNILSLDFAYISQGFLFKGAGFMSIIPLTKEQCPSISRQILVVFKKPQGFEGEAKYELDGAIPVEKIISGYSGTFNECAIILHQGKILKVTYSGKSRMTYYLKFDGRELKTLTWSEVVFGNIRRMLTVFG